MPQDTQLLIRVPGDLKGAYEGLCRSRGIKVSAALREFMVSEVLQAAATANIKAIPQKPPVSATKKRTTAKPKNTTSTPQAPEPCSLDEKCPDTMDLFDSPKNAQERTGAQVNPLEVQGYCNGVQNPNTGKIEVNRLVAAALQSSAKRKKKKR